MVERIAGRDQGGESQSSHIKFAQALRQAAATLRQAILAIADLGVGERGAIERPRPGTGWAAALRTAAATGGFCTPVLRHAIAPASASGSWLPESCGAKQCTCTSTCQAAWTPRCRHCTPRWCRCSGLLHPKVHLFSTRIDDIDLRQLARGAARVTTEAPALPPVGAGTR